MKKRLLLPLDGSDRDLISINYVRNNFNPEDVEIVLVNVGEVVFVQGMAFREIMNENERIGTEILINAERELEGYNCRKEFLLGYADKEIIECSNNNNIDTIIMAKNTKKKFTTIVGSVTSQVLKKANCTIIVLPQM